MRKKRQGEGGGERPGERGENRAGSEKRGKRQEKSFPGARPGEGRSVSIFPTRRMKECFTDHRALEEKQRNEGGKKRGRRFEKIIFLSPSHTLSIPLSHSLALTHRHTHTHSLLSSFHPSLDGRQGGGK